MASLRLVLVKRLLIPNDALEAEGVHVRVVSMPSADFGQDVAYKVRVLTVVQTKRLAIKLEQAWIVQIRWSCGSLLLILGASAPLEALGKVSWQMQVNFTNHCKIKSGFPSVLL